MSPINDINELRRVVSEQIALMERVVLSKRRRERGDMVEGYVDALKYVLDLISESSTETSSSTSESAEDDAAREYAETV